MGEKYLYLCRDCLNLFRSETLSRCIYCGSPRLKSDAEMESLSVAHIDCDSFYATIEKRDNPALLDKPVIVGGTGNRGVVSTACYIARSFGVHSAMPMFKARQLCPHAVYLTPDMEKYRKASRSLHAMMLDLTPVVESVSIDEAYLDLTGTQTFHKKIPALVLAGLASRVENELGITISIGLSYNRFLSKIASDMEKPRGYSIISRKNGPDFLAEKPVSIIPGIGKVTTDKLKKSGFSLLSDIRRADEIQLFKIMGKEASRLYQMAWGNDSQSITAEHITKSISSETTFDTDLKHFAEMEPILWKLCEKVSRRLKKSGLACRNVTLKLKDNTFKTHARTQSFKAPTQLASRLFEIAGPLLQSRCNGSQFRLIGVAAGDLCPAHSVETGDLSDPDFQKKQNVEQALDHLRDKFGSDVIQKGISWRFKK